MRSNSDQTEQPQGQEPTNPKAHAERSRSEADQGQPQGGIQMPETPKIELPKGGGAIRGMGEKFQANPVTGTGSFSVPIAMTAGRGGFTPALGLSYNSGSGNSPYGIGWSIGLPSISRKTSGELPQYKDQEESDTFLMSGAEDLIPTLIDENEDGNWIRDEYTVSGTPSYNVLRYRPRIEGLFARIERWVDTSSGESHWRSITRDNVTTWYGRTEYSRIADPDNPTRIFQWLIDETRDDKGNAIVYEYQKEDNYGIANALPEKNRLAGGTSTFPQRYLKNVCYGNTIMHDSSNYGDNEWLFQLAFDYGDLSDDDPTYDTNPQWDTRQDPYSTYRAGFEVRTYRLCKRILMFHNFSELGGMTLVKATELTHDENPTATRLTEAQHRGYKPGEDSETLPPMKFTYSEASMDDTLRNFDVKDLENLPMGVDGQQYLWSDLYGEGISGVLTEEPGGWFYKRNEGDEGYYSDHSVANPPEPEIRFGAQAAVASKPNFGGIGQVGDFNGDGQTELLIRSQELVGYFTLGFDSAQPANTTGSTLSGVEGSGVEGSGLKWTRFKHLENVPQVDWNDPNLRMIDLNGDGLPDILLSTDHCFRYWPSVEEIRTLSGAEGSGSKRTGAEGYGDRIDIPNYSDEEQGPKLVFEDAEQVIHMADMSGDGLTDIVRIRNREVCYWPNLGHGRFGKKVSMDGSPHLDFPEVFDKSRVRLADMDGSGTTDLIYLGTKKLSYWNNQSGNSFSLEKEIAHFPRTNNMSAVNVIDLFGKGTACLVWSSPLPGDIPYRIKYIDLFGEKPYMLKEVDNSMGGLHRYHYAPSTKFYLRDRQEGRPWITKLPFPVQVVERTEQFDQVTGARFVSRYAYHHGYFDHHEREFRGFGMVEQWDTEQYDKFGEDGLFQVGTNALDEESHIPPVHTKSWFHLGFWEREGTITQQYASEYYQGDNDAWNLPDSSLRPLSGVEGSGAEGSGEETRQAMRALKGQLLRSEVYAADDSISSEHPYTVSTANYQVKQIQPSYTESLSLAQAERSRSQGRRNHTYASFQVIPQESLSYQYERNAADPRVGHSMVLATDDYGLVTQSASIAYPRRNMGIDDPDAQKRGLISVSDKTFIHIDDEDNDTWKLGIPFRFYTKELTGVTLSSLQSPAEIITKIGAASVIDYSTAPDHTSTQIRTISGQMVYYWDDTLTNILSPGNSNAQALPHSSYQLAFTTAMRDAYNTNGITGVDHNMLTGTEARFTSNSGLYWAKSPTIRYKPDGFYLVWNSANLNGGNTSIQFDSYFLNAIWMRDPALNIVEAAIDYRTMSAYQTTDPNGNRQQVEFDALGMVTKVAVMGKISESLGDTLAEPTQRFSYALHNWTGVNPTPNWAKSEAREQHGGSSPTWLTSYEYTGGLGQSILQKVQAEPGDVVQFDSNGDLMVDANNNPVLTSAAERWVGTGRTIFNNKGKAVKQYEPYFSDTPNYEEEEAVQQYGVTPVVHYDPLGRVTRTDMPDGTFTKVEFDCWQQRNFDQNDTVMDSDWYDQIIVNPPASPNAPSTALIRAANLAAVHFNTPQVLQMDVMGRVFKTEDDNGEHNVGAGTTDHLYYKVVVEMDIEGKRRRVTNALDQETVFTYSMIPLDNEGNGQVIYTDSPDGGWRSALPHASGGAYRGWSERGFAARSTYDIAMRPTHAWMDDGGGEKLVGFSVYGDRSDLAITPETNNLRGQAIRSYDQSGVAKLTSVDFKRNVLASAKQLCDDYENVIDWSALTSAATLSALDSAADAIIDPDSSGIETFTTTIAYDALNRPVTMTLPDATVVKPTYNEAAFLEKMEAQIRGAATWTEFVKNIDYDAKGQRTKIRYGNDVVTNYSYDEKTFRLTKLYTTRNGSSNALQDLNYTFDAIGNIVEMVDDAQQTHFFNNAVVTPTTKYTYDALYRLLTATGREHSGQGQVTNEEFPVNTPMPHANNSSAVETYLQSYEYDALGNILKLVHQAASGNWTRGYHYDTSINNYLLKTSLPGNDVNDASTYTASYTYDVHGNMLSMPHLSSMQWDFADQLTEVDLGGGGTAHYVYSGGQRVRKVIVNGNLVKDRIYLGGNEIYREYVSGALTKERESLHIMDDQRRIALVETMTEDNGSISSPTPVIKYQLGNHLDSACLELDDSANANILTYEEYHPFGTSAYRLGTTSAEVSLKRYRYVGKELDDETGLYYYGARYHCPWLCRFVSVDPLKDQYGFQASFVYAANQPINNMDFNGESPTAYDVADEQAQGTYSEGLWDGFVAGGEAAVSAVGSVLSALMPSWEQGLVGATIDYFSDGENYYTKKYDQAEALYDLIVEIGSDEEKQTILLAALQDAVADYAKKGLFLEGDYEAGKVHGEILFEVALAILTEGAANSGKIIKALDQGYGATNALFKSALKNKGVQGKLKGKLGDDFEFQGSDNLDDFARMGGEQVRPGSLRITAKAPSVSEVNAAQHMKKQGFNVELRDPVGTRAGGETSDLLVDGVAYDVYTPQTSNSGRIVSAIGKKNSQATGIVLDLSESLVTLDQLGDVLKRVQNSGASRITSIYIIGR